MSKKKEQTDSWGMEFLMTYGWAILVVIAAIAALTYFQVIEPPFVRGGNNYTATNKELIVCQTACNVNNWTGTVPSNAEKENGITCVCKVANDGP